jgi:hypothetical protein
MSVLAAQSKEYCCFLYSSDGLASSCCQFQGFVGDKDVLGKAEQVCFLSPSADAFFYMLVLIRRNMLEMVKLLILMSQFYVPLRSLAICFSFFWS